MTKQTMATAEIGGYLFPHPETDPMGFLQVAFGQASIDKPPHFAIIMRGDGASGKSTFLRTVAEGLGDKMKQAHPEIFFRLGNADVDLSRYWETVADCTVSVVSDVPAGGNVAFNTQSIKIVTGGDMVRVRKFRDPSASSRDIRMRAMPVLVTNMDLPDEGDTLKRRIVSVTMPNDYTGDARIDKPTVQDVLGADSVAGWLAIGVALYRELNPVKSEQAA